MIKPLELTKKQVYILAAITTAAGIGFILFMGYAVASSNVVVERSGIVAPSETAVEAVEPAQLEETPSKPVTQATPQQAVPAPAQQAEPQQGAHIPFTNKKVTPGEPESYVDTVGQCPFYEIAGPKGCTPPSNFDCNDDWSKCELK